MTEVLPAVLPMTRQRPLDPPDELVRLQGEQPVSRLLYADGHVGWLVTGYAQARALLADPRFSTRQDLGHPLLSGSLQESREPAGPGFFIRMDPPEHTRYRAPLARHFSNRRVKELEPWIARVTAELLDAMEEIEPPLDLVEHFALALPSMVICELLGIRYEERGRYQRNMSTLLNRYTSLEERGMAAAEIAQFIAELVRHKRAEPADDLLSSLVKDGELTDEELRGIAFLLFGAGYETTVNMIALGVYALLTHPDQFARLRADISLTDTAVEELLRFLTVIHIGPVRTALEDAELGGQLIRKGESVALGLGAVNRDPSAFSDPATLDLGRTVNNHLAFGYGPHFCIGHQLARTELRIAIRALVPRFPRLRLAVPPSEVPMRHDMAFYGVHTLPVTWR